MTRVKSVTSRGMESGPAAGVRKGRIAMQDVLKVGTVVSLLVGATAVAWVPAASAASSATPACPLYINLLGKGWQNQTATVTASGAHGFIMNAPKATYGEVDGNVTVNLAQYPILQLDIAKVASGGQWNFTAQPASATSNAQYLSSAPVMRIGNNTSVTGVQTYNLEKIAQDSGLPTSGTYLFQFWPNGTNAPITMTYAELLPAGSTCPANSVAGEATVSASFGSSAATTSTTSTSTTTSSQSTSKTTSATTTTGSTSTATAGSSKSLPKTGSSPLARGGLAALLAAAGLALWTTRKRRHA